MALTDGQSLDGSVALVTGASAGIGRETAKALADEGADVALAARRRERLDEIAETIEAESEVETLVVPTDVTDPDEVSNMVAKTVDALGSLDLVVANAGKFDPTPVDEITPEDFRAMNAVNVDGMFYTAKYAMPQLRETQGTLLFVASAAGEYPRPQYPLYAASKWWTRGFALSLAGTVGDEDVAVSVINPTQVRTELGEDEQGVPLSEVYEEGEVSEPEDVAAAIAFAAGRDSPNMISEMGFYRRDAFADMF